MAGFSFEHHLLKEDGGSPNNEALPLIVYRDAVDVGGTAPENAVERAFGENDWGDGFRGDTYPFHHYHSTAHEVVGCARGKARLQFGGPRGPVVDVRAGDAVLIPAGVTHCRLDDAPGYVSVGAYPPGQKPDLCVLSEADAAAARRRGDTEGLELKVTGSAALASARAAVAGTPLPATDPVAGNDGPVAALWLRGRLSEPSGRTR